MKGCNPGEIPSTLAASNRGYFKQRCLFDTVCGMSGFWKFMLWLIARLWPSWKRSPYASGKVAISKLANLGSRPEGAAQRLVR
jgi:hypothetical protein